MFSALDIDLRPGRGFGIFEIGTSLWTLLDLLRRHPHAYPQIDIKYDPDTSATTPIIVHIRPHLDLLFSGKQQRLHTICIRKLRDPNPPVTVVYKDSILSSPEEVLRRVGVGRVFGPTYPGDELRYPGIWFSFDEDRIGEGLKVPHAGDRMQEVKRIIISQNDPEEKSHDALDEVIECSAMAGELARAVVKVHDGVKLYFYPTATSSPLHIRIGKTTAQDLTLDLGPPLRVHYKDDERMKIHAAIKASEPHDGTGYFYNYFQHGIDFLISESTHLVTKIVIHSNVPGSPLFQRYKRCNWEIEGEPEDDEDDTPPRKRFFDRFETISHFLSPREPPPSMSLDRTAEEEHLNLPNPTTHLHGYDGIILEATDSSQVVSVMLF
ncbi:hypothetical protein GALMADRAFT_235961 [Galerina marginata CBS 339.88]|uniref:Uncharacterized protein n=1 Tax=Galerina marginata (strain CBS 339.88) TaxID=685588 RepID=A0A067TMS9_GALM3|nr:hypothetical protein GALMADRAFT_235961 [Galerina marginata CBS 339.88]